MSESTRTLELAAPAPLSSAAAALAMAEAGAAAPLSRNFLRAQKLYGDVESSRLGGADAALQRQVGEALALCEVALKQVVGLSVFSSNEMVDDVNTGDLKYLLLPFYRGELLQRVVDQPRRRELLGESLACLRGFLDDLERMEALTAEARAAWRADGEPSAAADPAAVREAKIARVKASKAARDRMAVLAERQRGLGEDDDGTLPRNFFGANARNSLTALPPPPQAKSSSASTSCCCSSARRTPRSIRSAAPRRSSTCWNRWRSSDGPTARCRRRRRRRPSTSALGRSR